MFVLFRDSATKKFRLALNRNLPVSVSRVAEVIDLYHQTLLCNLCYSCSGRVWAMQGWGLGFSAACTREGLRRSKARKAIQHPFRAWEPLSHRTPVTVELAGRNDVQSCQASLLALVLPLLDRTCSAYSSLLTAPVTPINAETLKTSRQLIIIDKAMKVPFTVIREQGGNI